MTLIFETKAKFVSALVKFYLFQAKDIIWSVCFLKVKRHVENCFSQKKDYLFASVCLRQNFNEK